jgi:hypothetical protein
MALVKPTPYADDRNKVTKTHKHAQKSADNTHMDASYEEYGNEEDDKSSSTHEKNMPAPAVSMMNRSAIASTSPNGNDAVIDVTLLQV